MYNTAVGLPSPPPPTCGTLFLSGGVGGGPPAGGGPAPTATGTTGASGTVTFLIYCIHTPPSSFFSL